MTRALLDVDPKSSYFTRDELLALRCPEAGTVGDQAASSVGQLGENIVVQRGCLLGSREDGVMCGHVYNNVSSDPEVVMGRYAALLHLQPTNGIGFEDLEAIRRLGSDIGQHIIGMNPTVIDDSDEDARNNPSQVLTKQGFVLDDEVSVGDMLAKHGAKVTTFVRYALGETS